MYEVGEQSEEAMLVMADIGEPDINKFRKKIKTFKVKFSNLVQIEGKESCGEKISY